VARAPNCRQLLFGFQIGHKTAIVQWRDGKKVREAAHRGGARVSGGDSGARQGGARIGGTAAVTEARELTVAETVSLIGVAVIMYSPR
jgi:hypothetical protein